MLLSPAMERARNEGRRELLAVSQTTSRVAIARAVGVTPAAVSQWISGRTRPAARARRVLFELYRIAPESWGSLPVWWTHRQEYRRRQGPCRS